MDSFFAKVGKNSDLGLAVGLVGILAVMVVPLPPFLLDLMLSLAIGISFLLLLTAVYAKRALDFSIFPSLLLLTTLFRLALNVATTRKILLAHEFTPGNSWNLGRRHNRGRTTESILALLQCMPECVFVLSTLVFDHCGGNGFIGKGLFFQQMRMIRVLVADECVGASRERYRLASGSVLLAFR